MVLFFIIRGIFWRTPWWLIFFSITMCSVEFWSKFYVFRQYSIFFWLIKIIMFFMHNLTWQKVVLKYTWRRSFSHFRFSLASSILLSLSDTDNYYWYLQLSIHFWFKNIKGALSISQCPSIMQANFTYTYDSGFGNQCTGNTSLDVCSDVTAMEFDYSLCSAEQGYSGLIY